MQQFLEYIVKNLVDNPDCVNVHCVESEKNVIVELKVAQGDLGRVIGLKGLTIKALRTIATTACARLGYRVRIDLIK